MGIGLKSLAFYQWGFGKKMPSLKASELFGNKNTPVQFHAQFLVSGGLQPSEAVYLMTLASLLRCSDVFEIGTCSGMTAYNLASNIPGTVHTLDLPAENLSPVLPIEPGDKSFWGTKDEDRHWIGKKGADRIIPLRGDSATFNFFPYYKKMDLVFVDGAHSYEYVKKDSQTALSLIKDDGAIVWHDYAPAWSGVIKALNELSTSINLFHLTGTPFVMHLTAPALAKLHANR